jgi:hypothetical protein
MESANLGLGSVGTAASMLIIDDVSAAQADMAQVKQNNQPANTYIVH